MKQERTASAMTFDYYWLIEFGRHAVAATIHLLPESAKVQLASHSPNTASMMVKIMVYTLGVYGV